MHKLYDLKDMLFHEVDVIVDKGNFNINDLQVVNKLTDTIYKITMLEDGRYSQGVGTWHATGDYSSRNYRDGYDRGSSYGQRYSRADGRDQMIMDMERMLNDNTLPASDRNTIKRAMELMR